MIARLAANAWCRSGYDSASGVSLSLKAEFEPRGYLRIFRAIPEQPAGGGRSTPGGSYGTEVYRWTVQGGRLALFDGKRRVTQELRLTETSDGAATLYFKGDAWQAC